MRNRKIKLAVILISLVLIIAFVAWITVWGSSSKNGVIISNSTAPKSTPTYSDKQLNGSHVAFTYSGKYVVRNDGAQNDNLEHYTLSATTQYDKRILASVTNLSDGRLESNGAYILRQKSPQNYSSRTVKTNEGAFTIWVKTDKSEQTAMIAKGNKAAIISFVTANSSDNLTEEVNKLLNTFEWKQ